MLKSAQLQLQQTGLIIGRFWGGVLVGLDNFDYPSAEEDTTEQLTESLIVCLEKNTESLFFQTKRKKLS